MLLQKDNELSHIVWTYFVSYKKVFFIINRHDMSKLSIIILAMKTQQHIKLDQKIQKKEVILFDFDGTLINTDEANFLAYKEAVLKIKNIDLSALKLNVKRFTKEIIKNIFPDINAVEYKQIITIKNSVYKKYINKTSINTWALDIIKKFHKTKKIILTTNGSVSRVDLVLKHYNIMDLFGYKFYKENYDQAISKFGFALNYLRIDPELAIMFENERKEVCKAISCGILSENIIKIQGEKYRV
jgi:FMN phosphatase YigB (HAD superfamily)